MSTSAIKTKIEQILQNYISIEWETYVDLALKGDLLSMEETLRCNAHYAMTAITDQVIKAVSEELLKYLEEEAHQKGHRNIERRDLSIRLSTGHWIKVPSAYVKRPKKGDQSPRHLLAGHFKLIGDSSPLLYSNVAYSSMICPSYELANELLTQFGVPLSTTFVRSLTNEVANKCEEAGEHHVQLEQAECLAGKRVVISIDGGRSRLRQYTGKTNDQGNACYDTGWKEPKLFVIETLDEAGNLKREGLPIYGCRFSEKDVLGLLKDYLLQLQINQATQVQLIADGAPWIWNNLKPILLDCGVAEGKIIETLDYYHSSSYMYDLVDLMPKRVSQKQRQLYLAQFKVDLWDGQSNKIVEVCKQVYKKPNKIIKRYMNYLEKHHLKTQYADYEENKLLKGSGLIESGVRRIINLRFKNTSTFWNEKVVEKLYFLRAAIIAGRWNIVMQNLIGQLNY